MKKILLIPTIIICMTILYFYAAPFIKKAQIQEDLGRLQEQQEQIVFQRFESTDSIPVLKQIFLENDKNIIRYSHEIEKIQNEIENLPFISLF